MNIERKVISAINCIICSRAIAVELEIKERDPVVNDVVRILEGVHAGECGTVKIVITRLKTYRVKPLNSETMLTYLRGEIVILPDAFAIASAAVTQKARDAKWLEFGNAWTCIDCVQSMEVEN